MNPKMRSALKQLEAERDELKQQVEDLIETKDWLFEKWQGCESQLEEIHRSKMWTLWMSYLTVRRALISPCVASSRVLKKIGGGVSRAGKLLGLCFVWFSSTAITLRARARRRKLKPRGVDTRPESIGLGEIRPKVLLVTPYHIYPANHGGGVRLFNLVRLLSKTCDLYLLVFSVSGEDREQREALEPYCVRVDFHKWNPQHRPDRFGIKPPNAQLFWSEKVAARIRGIVLEYGIDIVQLEYTELGQYAELVPEGVPVILTEHDIAFRTQKRRLALGFKDRYPDSAAYCAKQSDVWRLLVHEIKVCRESDRVHTMSELDREYLLSFLPAACRKIRVAPNGVDCEALAPPKDSPRRNDVLYVGNFQNLPNMDALEYLVNDVWPILRLRCPTARLIVVGAHAEGRVTHFDGTNGIRVVGEVPDLSPYYHRHRVLAAPIRAGSGTRLKILEAFAAGIPVVSTSLGAEGIAYENGRHLLIADDAVSFAAAIERLVNDDETAQNLAQQAMELARARYDWKRVAKAIEADYAELMQSKID
jgi:glycosyltransferase involved in cell wall biosynthesis